MSQPTGLTGLSEYIWDAKYRFRDHGTVTETDISATWRRVARAIASVEPNKQEQWERRFFDALSGFKFLPGGRILAGAGTGKKVTLFNCFVMGVIEDSIDGIFNALREGAITMQQGGGVGYDFSTLRPYGLSAQTTGTIASGPVTFMRVWDAMCATLLSTGTRRGAMMATLRCDHPDIELFVDAKKDRSALRNFNLSVLVSDDFIAAVREDDEWPLVFPEHGLVEPATTGQASVQRRWSGTRQPVDCRVFRTVSARSLWDRIMRATYDYAEPGVLFLERINEQNNLWFREYISATNPCGEIPLPPYGACNLGSINLTAFVRRPFSAKAKLDLDGIRDIAEVATRMLDNVIDLTRYPITKQAEQALGTRRLGLGITGLADALIMLGFRYDRPEARELAEEAMRTICHAAFRTSVKLAVEKGEFPFLDRRKYLEGPFIRNLPGDIGDAIAQGGIRNSHLTAIAPAGSISLLADNISSGVEPVFDFIHRRRVLGSDGRYFEQEVEDYAHRRWRALDRSGTELPDYFVNAGGVAPASHLDMQAAVQRYVDNAVSKTINVPRDYPFERFRDLYQMAYDRGLKGCTTFRPNPVTESVLTTTPQDGAERTPFHCCSLEREGD